MSIDQAAEFFNKHIKSFELGETLITNSGVELKWDKESITTEINDVKYTLSVYKYYTGDVHEFTIETGSDEDYEEFHYTADYLRYIRGKYYKWTESPTITTDNSHGENSRTVKSKLPKEDRTGVICEIEVPGRIFITESSKDQYNPKSTLENLLIKCGCVCIKRH